MKRVLAILLLLAPGAAFAQSAPDRTGEASQSTVEPSTVAGSPCPYPDELLHAGVQGTTWVQYRVDNGGLMMDIEVRRSSGNSDLDRATKACVRHWRAKDGWPALGVRIDEISWVIPTSPGAPPPAGRVLPRAHNCGGWYPPDAFNAGIGGTSRVRFTITKGGGIRDPEIVLSSGNAELDQAALACVKTWRYHPAMQNDLPVEAPWEALVRWDPPPAPDSGR